LLQVAPFLPFFSRRGGAEGVGVVRR
jgi:hypothetical protein